MISLFRLKINIAVYHEFLVLNVIIDLLCFSMNSNRFQNNANLSCERSMSRVDNNIISRDCFGYFAITIQEVEWLLNVCITQDCGDKTKLF